MVVMELRCQICGRRFEAAVLDPEDRDERERPSSPVRCPNCGSSEIQPVRTIGRVAKKRGEVLRQR